MKFKASEFMNRSSSRNFVELPTIVVSKRAGTASHKAGKRRTIYNIGTLDELVDTFDENERSLKAS